MSSLKEIRTRKLMIALNDWWNEMTYYDDDTQEVVIRDTERGCYDSIMKDDELHLLGERFVEGMIHLMFSDWESFVILSNKFKAY